MDDRDPFLLGSLPGVKLMNHELAMFNLIAKWLSKKLYLVSFGKVTLRIQCYSEK